MQTKAYILTWTTSSFYRALVKRTRELSEMYKFIYTCDPRTETGGRDDSLLPPWCVNGVIFPRLKKKPYPAPTSFERPGVNEFSLIVLLKF